jgi:hypothetical protein
MPIVVSWGLLRRSKLPSADTTTLKHSDEATSVPATRSGVDAPSFWCLSLFIPCGHRRRYSILIDAIHVTLLCRVAQCSSAGFKCLGPSLDRYRCGRASCVLQHRSRCHLAMLSDIDSRLSSLFYETLSAAPPCPSAYPWRTISNLPPQGPTTPLRRPTPRKGGRGRRCFSGIAHSP